MKLSIETPAELSALLRRAAAAHHDYEQQTGTPDANWPDWYAKWIFQVSENRANLERAHECLNALERKIARENFIRRACFGQPINACEWARANAHAPFTAFCADGRTILVQPLEPLKLDGLALWHWTEHVCPVHPPTPTSDD